MPPHDLPAPAESQIAVHGLMRSQRPAEDERHAGLVLSADEAVALTAAYQLLRTIAERRNLADAEPTPALASTAMDGS